MNHILIPRRDFLTLGGSSLALLTTSGAMALPSLRSENPFNTAPSARKFVLFVVVEGGWDPTCLCDARPRSMTDANLIQNYFPEHPEPLLGVNGGSCLVSSAFSPLKGLFHDRHFSILNGVLMAVGNDGHPQNINYIFTGNPFGGDSFLPHLSASGNFPLSYLQMGNLFGLSVVNGASAISMDVENARAFADATRAVPAPDLNSPLYSYLNERNLFNSRGNGKLSQGVSRFRTALASVSSVREKIASIELNGLEGLSETQRQMRLVHSFYKSALTNAAMIKVNNDIFVDAHDVTTATTQPTSYLKIAERIAEVFTYLRDTKLIGGEDESLLSQTTVVVTSEFSRTMRQNGVPITATGTDHNPLNNSVILGGRGVQGGQIIGESDFQHETEILSNAHLSQDPFRFRLMGRPFNFDDLSPVRTPYERFELGNYLSFASIGNTLMSAHGVDPVHFWKNERNGPVSPLLDARIYA